jgi:hypothetical protein
MTTNGRRIQTRRVGLLLALCVAAFDSFGCKSVRPAVQIGAPQLSVEAKQVLSWLPANTETLLTARGPFLLPNSQRKREDYTDHKTQAQDLRQAFQGLTVGLFALGNGGLVKQLAGKQTLFAAEGSRAFRTPNGLGELPYEGCAIVVFADDLGDTQETFMKTAGKNALRIDDIEGHKVAVFQEKMEQDIWTMFVVFPTKNTVVVATNHDYLSEVLARMRAPGITRAFPESLEEWKYVDTQAEFWGMRHFDRSQSQLDPTSPFGGRKPANLPDEQAVGLIYQCAPGKDRKATLVYLSGDKNGIKHIERNRFPKSSEVESTAALHIEYRDIGPEAILSSYDLSRSRPLSWFMFVFMAYLGHAVYV